ncbi:hypothetical protein ATPR_3302 [Acetobacter tropicalis NBRC 101654]|uniref:Uncharacterized protein n=1 Tax=Acetobacter tropicalis NBRC 101654 TaxID=749388 RepID=F7VIV3_9PROT|nr:hypothetical protein ATPR_3302 [Acetobacter tropicalis NBRC 101654]
MADHHHGDAICQKMPDHYCDQIRKWWAYDDWSEIQKCVPYTGQPVHVEN